jgi:hypothetical protein
VSRGLPTTNHGARNPAIALLGPRGRDPNNRDGARRPTRYSIETLNLPVLGHNRSGFSLCEIHPITEFFVCPAGDGCDPGQLNQWQTLTAWAMANP